MLDPAIRKLISSVSTVIPLTEIKTFDPNGLYAGKGGGADCACPCLTARGLEESCENTVEAVSNLFYGLPIHGYCALNTRRNKVLSMMPWEAGGYHSGIPGRRGMKINGKGYGYNWSAGDRNPSAGEPICLHKIQRHQGSPGADVERPDPPKTYLQGFVNQAKAAVEAGYDASAEAIYAGFAIPMVTDISADEAVYLAGQALSYSFDEMTFIQWKGMWKWVKCLKILPG